VKATPKTIAVTHVANEIPYPSIVNCGSHVRLRMFAPAKDRNPIDVRTATRVFEQMPRKGLTE
jgi:hypothetical protein